MIAKVQRVDLSEIVRIAVRYHMHGYVADSVIEMYRRIWPELDDYGRRQALTSMEVEIALDKYDHDQPETKAAWSRFIEEIRPPKAPFTVAYRCGKCRAEGLKLWRGVHGCKDDDGHELLCARCLAPDVEVGEDGRAMSQGRCPQMTDQVGDWLPAVPVDDTFWGYSSVPTADVRWWRALPTYRASQPSSDPPRGE